MIYDWRRGDDLLDLSNDFISSISYGGDCFELNENTKLSFIFYISAKAFYLTSSYNTYIPIGANKSLIASFFSLIKPNIEYSNLYLSVFYWS